MKEHTPTKAQFQRVIDNLESIEEAANREGALNLDEVRVYEENNNYKCGSVHCLGGWYAVACQDREEIINEINSGYCDWEQGADLMSRDLGFKNNWTFSCWAHENSQTWGNDNGEFLFCKKFAWNICDESRPMSGIINHLRGVQERIEA